MSRLSSKISGGIVTIARRSFSSGRVSREVVRSSGAIFDPYVYRGPGGTPLPAIWSKGGLKTRVAVVRGHLVSGISQGMIQKHIPGFHAKKFPSVAEENFATFLEAHRKGDFATLAGVTTDGLYDTLKSEIKASVKKGRSRSAFRLLEFREPAQVLQMRHHRPQRMNKTIGWGQVTCKLCCVREKIMVNAKGNEIVRPKGEQIPILDNVTIGTFEFFFADPTKRWRIAFLEELATGPGATGRQVFRE